MKIFTATLDFEMMLLFSSDFYASRASRGTCCITMPDDDEKTRITLTPMNEIYATMLEKTFSEHGLLNRWVTAFMAK